MTREETIQQDLLARFPVLADSVRIQRDRRLWAQTPYAEFRGILDYACDRLEFVHLCTITGLDEGENLAFIYHLAREDGVALCLKTAVPKAAPVLKSISDRFPGGVIYERELVDLLGAKVDGLPPGNRYPLPDDWPEGQHPLRKDWKVEMLTGESPALKDKPHG
jgi:membrane-bound hydrogenase subunit beta